MVNTIHPMFVHFPIALLIIAGVIALIDIVAIKYQLKRIILWLLFFAATGAIITVVSGFMDAGVIPHNLTIHEILKTHQFIGITIMVLSIILYIWLVLRITKMNKLENFIFVLVLFIALALVSYNAYLGGKMVYDNGAGIKPMQKTFLLEDHDHDE